jgi:hypothetical protein
LAALFAGSSSSAAAPAWPDIKVEVKVDQPVATTQSLKEPPDGFQRLACFSRVLNSAKLLPVRMTLKKYWVPVRSLAVSLGDGDFGQ